MTTAAASAAPDVPPAAPAPPAEPNRLDCEQIIGNTFLSTSERDWYYTFCLSEESRLQLAQFVDLPNAEAAGTMTERFVSGFVDAGGPVVHLGRILHRVIPCESGGNPHAYSRVGPFYGLMQFLGGTWETVGGGDWRDPYLQGANTARLLARANPATQWPVCWFA